MGIFSGCLLASDFDGTLANSRGFIDDEVKRAIKYFTDNGGFFTVCTGRTKQGFHSYDPELMNAPVLLANGAMAYNYATGEKVFTQGITEDSIEALEYIRDHFDGIGIEYYGSDFSGYIVNPDERNIRHFKFLQMDYTVAPGFVRAAFPLVKVMVSVGKDRCGDFQRFLDDIDLCGMKYIPQYGDFIELISEKTDKGRGLLTLAEMLGVDRARVFAVGDGANDVSMLKAAAFGFVPENGDVLAKQAGDIGVSSNDEFAVAEVIAKIKELI